MPSLLIALLKGEVPCTVPPEQYVRCVSFAEPGDAEAPLAPHVAAARARDQAAIGARLLGGETFLHLLVPAVGGNVRRGRAVIEWFEDAGLVTLSTWRTEAGHLRTEVFLTDLGRVEVTRLVQAWAAH